jgi:hypothetical protein
MDDYRKVNEDLAKRIRNKFIELALWIIWISVLVGLVSALIIHQIQKKNADEARAALREAMRNLPWEQK